MSIYHQWVLNLHAFYAVLLPSVAALWLNVAALVVVRSHFLTPGGRVVLTAGCNLVHSVVATFGFYGPRKTDWTNRRPPQRLGRTLNLLSRLRWRHEQVWIKSERSSALAWQWSVCLLLSVVCLTLSEDFCWKVEYSYYSYLSVVCILLTSQTQSSSRLFHLNNNLIQNCVVKSCFW